MTKNVFRNDEIYKICDFLNNNEVVCVPTDTVFGLCTKIDSIDAYNKLVEIKNRPKDKAFPIMCSDIKQIEKIAYVNEKAKILIDKLMPGPLTIILNKKPNVPYYVTNGKNTIAVRLAATIEIKKIIDYINCPLFMTSANISGYSPCLTVNDVLLQFPNLKAILDGEVQYSYASTIIDCCDDDIKIIRDGPISVKYINDILI